MANARRGEDLVFLGEEEGSYIKVAGNGGEGWVRKSLIKTALGDAMPEPGKPLDPNAPRVNNGITGDGRRASAELGKRVFEMKVDYAVRQIRSQIGTQ